MADSSFSYDTDADMPLASMYAMTRKVAGKNTWFSD